MIIGNICYRALVILFVAMILEADISVKLSFSQKSVKPGDYLTVRCLIYNTTSGVQLKTSLSCPFINKSKDYCFLDCVNVCQYSTCTDKEKFIENIECNVNGNNDPLIFSFRIRNISKEQIDDRKVLPFSCKYKGVEVRENVLVTETVESNTKPDSGTSLVTESPTTTKQQSNFLDLDLRNIILIVLISSLITSFLINVWCCVQWCMRRAKIKKRKRLTRSQINSQIIQDNKTLMAHQINDNDESPYPGRFYTDEYIRRTRSQPLLHNDGKSTPVKISSSNLSKPRIGSVNNNSNYRMPIYNHSVNEIYQDGSIQEQINDNVGLPIIGYMNSPYIPMQNFVYPMPQYDHMNISRSEDLDTLTERNTPETRESSAFQPLPTRPQDCLSNIESSSSSHIV